MAAPCSLSEPLVSIEEGEALVSSGRLHIERAHRERGLYYRDLYHTIADSNVWYILFFLLLAYVAVSVLFGLLWWAASDACDVGIENFNAAFLFSVETMMTIGYGTRPVLRRLRRVVPHLRAVADRHPAGLREPGPRRTSLSSGVGRSSTILFGPRSSAASAASSPMFQVVEMRSHQLIEGHVRCYAVRDETDARGRVAPFQQCAMRLDKPDDELGGWLFLALPSVVVHRLDAWSPLVPPAPRVEARGAGRRTPAAKPRRRPMATYAFPALQRRTPTPAAGPRSAATCAARPTRTPAASRATSRRRTRPPPPLRRNRRAAVDAFMEASGHEIVVVVEGVDPITSNTVQATHSYCYRARDGEDRRDVVWDCDFRPCVSRDDRGRCRIDYAAFHELVAAADGAPPPPPCSH
ncbi:hypothetical protein JL720_15557 [Aureococcus anophagefferens]|nr:hypothetical protein JL720_15557 [Aureococcus anophagefferens]